MSKEQKKKQPVETEEVPHSHWADHAADQLTATHPQKKRFVCASGISPSGMVHIGNFREAITVDFVVRALKDRGKEVRFLYSWDDYDAFRKVPVNLPKQEMLIENLRKPTSAVPDPFGQTKSYATYFEKSFEEEIARLGLNPEFIYQNEPYRRGEYLQGILHALENEKTIREILDRYRTEPLPEDWTCISIFCKHCQRDTTDFLGYTKPSLFRYRCTSCQKEDSIDAQKEGGVKLLWRVDWPMRWAKESVDFEPGGKDHSSQGGSYETGAEIIRAVWKTEPPQYLQYDFVVVKGGGAKLSSSSGQLITLGQALEVYEPAVVRWIFASRKPNIDFAIAFDLDVMKAYDDFDRCERYAYGVEEGEPKKVGYERRIYEFAVIKAREKTPYGELPAQFPFRHLCSILQIHQGDLGRTRNFFADRMKTPLDDERFVSRAARAWKWIHDFAPEDFKFHLRTPNDPRYRSKHPEAVKALIDALGKNSTEEELSSAIFELLKANSAEPKQFFQDCYQILVGKTSGPKLASFLIAMGNKKAVELLTLGLP